MPNSKPYTTDGLNFYGTAPRMWHGMTVSIWVKMLARNGFRVSPARLPMCLSITAASVVNSALRLWEEMVNGRRVDAVEIQPPLMIVGHWRTGTTLLHELMVLDDQFSYPTTLQVMAPHHFLSSGWLARPLLRWTLPAHRPMDAMEMGIDLPQEDEFAICNLGLDSSYVQWGWPNCREFEKYLDFSVSSPSHQQRWRRLFVRFLKRLAVADPRRVVLKSPTHTARLGLFHELFPQAQYVHLTRDPREVIPSMIRTFQRLHYMQGLQTPHFDELEDSMFALFTKMHELEQRDRAQIPPEQYVDLRYDALVADPLGAIGDVYERFGLSGFDQLRPKLTAYFEAKKSYRPNRHELPPALAERIERECGDYMQQFGYTEPVEA
ncbi:MAG: sulfotransferase [Planctomycetales bacterium]|nr:sulfotransferase [Planctomycetales bacterium]